MNKDAFSFASKGLSAEEAEEIWFALRKAIEEIQKGNAINLRFEELYRNAYTLVLHKHGDLLYLGVMDTIVAKLEGIAQIVSSASNEQILEVIVDQWEKHKLITTMTSNILMYLDNTYCKYNKKTPVYKMGLLLFQHHVVRYKSVNTRLKAVLLENVFNERMGEVIDRVLMKNCLAMLVEVAVDQANKDDVCTDVYREEFEDAFLSQTRHFYKQEAQDFMSRNTVPDYLRKVEERLRQEDERADAYLDKSTKAKLRDVIQEELITQFAARLVENDTSGAIPMFMNNQEEDLARMYKLFYRVKPTLEFLRQAMSALVKETGTNIVKDQENLKNPKMFVQQVLDCRQKFHNIVTNSFKQSRSFSKTLKEALEYFINLDSRAAQYLSLYIDDMLKKGLKGVPEQVVDQRLKDVISIFRYCQDKDVFEDFYKQHLASRLLSGQSGNEDVEKAMISKLKAECGHQFTSRLEGMFKDMHISEETMKGYARYCSNMTKRMAELNVTVLTTGFWPVPVVPPCTLPPVAQQASKHFINYYTGVHSGRRLALCPNLGTAELRCQFDKGRKDLVVHTYQMCILMLFNKQKIYTYKEIRELTNIPEQELSRHLLSLAHPKVRVLKKNPNNKKIADNHKFMYNMGYTSKLFRVKIKLLSAASVVQKKAEVPAGVVEARKNRVEASIVRIMKSRKTLDHNNLVTEVVKQLTNRFRVEPSFIKKRIESLIEREYLERDENNRRVYKYLA